MLKRVSTFSTSTPSHILDLRLQNKYKYDNVKSHYGSMIDGLAFCRCTT